MAADGERTRLKTTWETIYRWDWFRRDQWLPVFRWVRRALTEGGPPSDTRPQAVSLGSSNPGLHWAVHLAAARSASVRSLLDCSCGLGLKTIAFGDAGVEVTGSDGCALALEHARELADQEGRRIEYFESEWAELPGRTPRRFDGVFCDGLMWLPSPRDVEAALRGICDVLSPEGVLLWSGVPFDEPARAAPVRGVGEPGYWVHWTHARDGCRCTCIKGMRELRADDETSYLFLIEDDDGTRLETATIRSPITWTAEATADLLRAAGFSRWETRRFDTPTRKRAAFNLAWT
jgi:SAM-dependent methyltransferase